MKTSDLSEFQLIERLTSHGPAPSLPRLLSIGDDAAVVPKDDFTDLIYTTDLLIEGTHFLQETISPHDLGFKALSVNLSDIAAMGGSPRYCFLSLALPKNLEVEWIDGFASGFFELSKKFSVSLIGGDTTRSDHGICINVLVVGDVKRGQARLRSMAQPGDKVAVTGFLGESLAGLRLLQKEIEVESKNSEAFHLIQSHRQPLPHVEEGLWLTRQKSVHAMMDVSDGLHSDIQHIMERSQVGCRIDLDRLPLSSDLKLISAEYQWSARELAAAGGEDYCLLLTFDPSDQDRLQESFKKQFNRNLFVLGEITDDQGILQYHQSGQDTDWKPSSGFHHFA